MLEKANKKNYESKAYLITCTRMHARHCAKDLIFSKFTQC